MKACIYLRVSTQKQGISGLGIESQREICLNYIYATGKEFEVEFKDVESGASRQRPGLLRAIDYCKENNCELVFAKLDRLARDVEFTFRVINTGIQVHFCDMPQLNTLVLGVMASVAQYERELTSLRTKQALKAKKDRGEQTGGSKGLWGKNTGTDRIAVLNKANAASVESKKEAARMNPNNRAFHEFIEDWQAIHGKITANTDFAPIAEKLNERGKLTSTGQPFNKARARAMYSRIKYLY